MQELAASSGKLPIALRFRQSRWNAVFGQRRRKNVQRILKFDHAADVGRNARRTGARRRQRVRRLIIAASSKRPKSSRSTGKWKPPPNSRCSRKQLILLKNRRRVIRDAGRARAANNWRPAKKFPSARCDEQAFPIAVGQYCAHNYFSIILIGFLPTAIMGRLVGSPEPPVFPKRKIQFIPFNLPQPLKIRRVGRNLKHSLIGA